MLHDQFHQQSSEPKSDLMIYDSAKTLIFNLIDLISCSAGFSCGE